MSLITGDTGLENVGFASLSSNSNIGIYNLVDSVNCSQGLEDLEHKLT